MLLWFKTILNFRIFFEIFIKNFLTTLVEVLNNFFTIKTLSSYSPRISNIIAPTFFVNTHLSHSFFKQIFFVGICWWQYAKFVITILEAVVIIRKHLNIFKHFVMNLKLHVFLENLFIFFNCHNRIIRSKIINLKYHSNGGHVIGFYQRKMYR